MPISKKRTTNRAVKKTTAKKKTTPKSKTASYKEKYDAKRDKKKLGKAHPGFKKVAKSIAKKEGISEKAAGAILASSTRKASAAAKKANPRLKKVRMPKRK